jgi:transposase
MSTAHDALPENIDHLQAMVRELLDHIQSLQSENAQLKYFLARLQHRLYGRRSEKIDPNQLQLLFDDEQANESVASRITPPPFVGEAPDAEEPPRRKKGRPLPHPGRMALPAHLSRQRIEIHPESLACPCCQGELRRLGEEISEELGRQPARFFVRQYVRVKYACPRCQDQIVRPPLPARPIERGLAGSDVISEILVSKFADHLPLHRQAVIYRREGVPLDKATMCDWVARSAELLAPIVARMREELLSGPVVQADETPVQYLVPRDPGPKRRGYLWAYVGDHEDVVYDFTTTRAQQWPNQFLTGYQGHLQVDGYAGYNEVLGWSGVVHVACWAHARRKFIEARATDPQYAAAALLAIRALYATEARARDENLDVAALTALRQQEAVPVLADLEGYLRALLPEALPKSPLGRATAYALARWPALTVYAQDGRIPIDNNSVERAMRRVAVGRKNWLFAGSPAGGERAAIIYSLIETCSRHGINPHDYLTDVLQRLDTHPQRRIAELTPRGWLAARTTVSTTHD